MIYTTIGFIIGAWLPYYFGDFFGKGPNQLSRFVYGLIAMSASGLCGAGCGFIFELYKIANNTYFNPFTLK
ncbi:MAG TPA: hypothetical protein VLG50_08340 [Candidatus Saccharimonadales bacterium]|nr:hypothetical protein [Candidatus Saccharimonadales bacterium]